jgi:hypothetical protein
MFTKTWCGVLSALALAGASAFPGDARAELFWREASAQYCQPVGSSTDAPIGRWSSGLWWQSTAASGQVVCPMPDDANLPKDKVRLVNVHCYDRHPAQAITARTCASWEGGIHCSLAGNSADGACVIQLTGVELSAWQNHPWLFKSVYVTLPPQWGNVADLGASVVTGIYEHGEP